MLGCTSARIRVTMVASADSQLLVLEWLEMAPDSSCLTRNIFGDKGIPRTFKALLSNDNSRLE